MPPRDRPMTRRPVLAGLAVAGIALVAGAAWYSLVVRPGPDASPSASSATWGPLAVVDIDYGAEARFAGILRITETCAFVEEDGLEPTLVIWPDKRTGWHEDAREVTFQNRDGREATLRDGDEVSFSGGGDSVSEGGLPGDEWVKTIDWVAEPDPSCPLDARWTVNEVVDQP